MDLVLTAGEETADLWTWLSRESDLRGLVRTRPGATPAGTMGAEIVILMAVMGVSALARSICGYLAVRERSRSTDLDLTVTTKSGTVKRCVVNRSTDPLLLASLLLGTDEKDDDPTEKDRRDAPAKS